MTYDDAPLIRSLYADYEQHELSLYYSAQSKRLETELLMTSKNMLLPDNMAVAA